MLATYPQPSIAIRVIPATCSQARSTQRHPEAMSLYKAVPGATTGSVRPMVIVDLRQNTRPGPGQSIFRVGRIVRSCRMVVVRSCLRNEYGQTHSILPTH
jgi:hypothetical protein